MKVTITVIPLATPVSEEDLQSIRDIITDLITNLLDFANSIKSSNKIIDILTDNNSDNDQLVCEFLRNTHKTNK
jgi:hypothetical protein